MLNQTAIILCGPSTSHR